MRRRWAMITIGALLLSGCTAPSSGPTTTLARPPQTTTSPPTTSVGHSPNPAYDLSALLNDLTARGGKVRVLNEGTHGSAVLNAPEVTICLDREPLRVFEYTSERNRSAASAGIDPTGSTIRGAGGKISMVEWVGPPHFYARGRIIVLYLGASTKPTTQLAKILGKSLSPRARNGGISNEPTC